MEFLSYAVLSTVSMTMTKFTFKTKLTRAAAAVKPQPHWQPQQPPAQSQRGSLTFIDQAIGYFTYYESEQNTEPPQQQHRSRAIASETDDGVLVGKQGNENGNGNGTKATDDDLLCSFGRSAFDDDGGHA
jgi:hypothetical protein